MHAPDSITVADPGRRTRIALGILLLGAGFLGHFLAARAIGGTYRAYRDHMLGFVLLTLVSAAIVAPLVWRFRRGRHDITLLTVGLVQARRIRGEQPKPRGSGVCLSARHGGGCENGHSATRLR